MSVVFIENFSTGRGCRLLQIYAVIGEGWGIWGREGAERKREGAGDKRRAGQRGCWRREEMETLSVVASRGEEKAMRWAQDIWAAWGGEVGVVRRGAEGCQASRPDAKVGTEGKCQGDWKTFLHSWPQRQPLSERRAAGGAAMQRIYGISTLGLPALSRHLHLDHRRRRLFRFNPAVEQTIDVSRAQALG